MNERSATIREYECDNCHDRFEVVMTFREQEPFDRDEQGRVRTAGYPEQHPECPACHSHDVVRVDLRKTDSTETPQKTNHTETPTIETTVGDLVAQRPSRSRVFEKLGIDYCCGGKKSLSEACAAKGLDADIILTTLLAAEEGTSSDEQNWARAGLSDLADHIEKTHHAYLKTELPRLEQIIAKVLKAHGSHHPELAEVQRAFAALQAELVPHMFKEEQILFPAIRRLEQSDVPLAFPFGTVANPIRMMEHEHDTAGDALGQIRRETSDYRVPDDACNTYRAMLDGLLKLEQDLHRHIHKENNILFPRAIEWERSRGQA